MSIRKCLKNGKSNVFLFETLFFFGLFLTPFLK